MTKEIKKEKIDITLDVFNNIKAMIKSSNEEDFFIGVQMWFAMDPPDMLTAVLKKHAWKGRAYKFAEHAKAEGKWSLHMNYHRLTWPAIMNFTIANKEYTQYKDILEQEFTNYVNQKLLNEGIGNHIKPIKLELKWQN